MRFERVTFDRDFSAYYHLLDLSGSIAVVGKGGSLNVGYSSSKSSSETYINSLLSAGVMLPKNPLKLKRVFKQNFQLSFA